MIRCQICGECTLSGEKPMKRAIQTRTKTYPRREDVYTKPKNLPYDKDWISYDKGGTGVETVREISGHRACLTFPDFNTTQ